MDDTATMDATLAAPARGQKLVPGHGEGLPLIGIGLEFQRNPLAALRRMTAKYGDLLRMRVGPHTFYLANDPALVKQIFKTRAANFGKQNVMYHDMATLFGRATAVVDGERWRAGAKLIYPSFGPKGIEAALGIIQRSVDRLAAAWADLGASVASRPAGEDIAAMTLGIIVDQMFEGDIGGREAEISSYFKTLVDFIAIRLTSVARLPLWVPTPQHRRYHRAITKLDQLIFKLIARHNEKSACPHAAGMLAQWQTQLRAGKAPGLSAADLRDEVVGIFVAAHGSTAVFLSWILYHLAMHPDIQERARAEVDALLGERPAQPADLEQMTYLGMVIEETMRLTPPGWIVSRSAVEPHEFDGFVLPAGAMVLVSPYLLHHHPAYWREPERFDPERFAPENAAWLREMSDECRYIPFTAGKRQCIGKNLAIAEAKLVVSSLLRRFRLRVPPGAEVTPEGRFTLNLKGGLNLSWERLK